MPAFDTSVNTNGNETLLADYTAEASSLTARSNVCERVSQVVELATVEELLGHIVLQPQDFGDLHLNGHLSAHISQKVMVGRIDLVRLIHGAVVEPKDDIAVVAVFVIKVWSSNCDRLIGVFSEDCERARRVETNATNGVAVDIVLV